MRVQRGPTMSLVGARRREGRFAVLFAVRKSRAAGWQPAQRPHAEIPVGPFCGG